MIDPIEQHLTLAAVYKFMGGEPMSPQDLTRVIQIFDTGKLELAQVDAPTVAGLRIKLKTVLQARYLTEQKQTMP